mmetsp:Transcript_27256/g.74592  ORF Transcript_27256/g.74592 Transcript_27256/m.74592 type:complete len:439 (+) Transcript_27256:100-1416(+)
MSTDNTTESSEPRKRPRVEGIENAKDGLDASETVANTEEKPTPEYGSQEYWEDRYKSKPGDQDATGEGDPEPHHAWYFKFEDLAPLLMPLIIGDDEGSDGVLEEEDDDDENGTSDSKEEKNSKNDGSENKTSTEGENNLSSQEDKEKPKAADDKNQGNDKSDLKESEVGNTSDNESGEDSDEFEVIEMDDDDDDDQEPVVRVGLAKDGPISVLEVGCGDAPLGRDLALSIQECGISIGQDPSSIVQKIVCLDYSKNVIETMKEEQQKNQVQGDAKEKVPPLLYEVADARQLSYQNESFEMILEKGTLDAMLSDSNGSGQENCRKIVSECARVLKVGGYIIIISHLNARVESGLHWLNDVVVPGLRAAGDFEWLVEVHGSDVEIPSEDEEDTEEEKFIESPGPAVYFIEKVGITSPTKKSDGEQSEESPPTIPLKFFSY